MTRENELTIPRKIYHCDYHSCIHYTCSEVSVYIKDYIEGLPEVIPTPEERLYNAILIAFSTSFDQDYKLWEHNGSDTTEPICKQLTLDLHKLLESVKQDEVSEVVE